MTELPHSDDAASKEDEDKRRKLILIWILLAVALLVLILLFSLCSGSNDELVAVPTTTTTTTADATAALTPITNPPPETTTTTEPPTIDGIWTMNVDVTVATGACSGEEEEAVTPDTVTISQNGGTLTIVGLGFPKQEQVWQGQIDGNRVTFGGQRTEDGGRRRRLSR